jgi:hypothetical protein
MKLHQITNHIQEAIHPQDLQTLQNYGLQIIDQLDTHGYTITLIKIPNQILQTQPYPPHFQYQLALAKNGHQFTNPQTQHTKHPTTTAQGIDAIPKIKQKINNWLKQHNTLTIASHNQNKTNTYKHILNHLGYTTQTHQHPIPHLTITTNK